MLFMLFPEEVKPAQSAVILPEPNTCLPSSFEALGQFEKGILEAGNGCKVYEATWPETKWSMISLMRGKSLCSSPQMF